MLTLLMLLKQTRILINSTIQCQHSKISIKHPTLKTIKIQAQIINKANSTCLNNNQWILLSKCPINIRIQLIILNSLVTWANIKITPCITHSNINSNSHLLLHPILNRIYSNNLSNSQLQQILIQWHLAQ